MSMYSTDDIARFVEGDMTDRERELFEEAVKTDTELQADLAYYRHVKSSLRMTLAEDTRDEEFKASLSEISSDHFKQQTKIVPLRRYLAWSSAVAAILVLVFIWSPWNKDLYRQYADTEMLAVAERSDANADQNLEQAVEAFNKKDFEAAKTFLERVNKAEPDNAMANFYYGITLLETGEIATSRQILTALYHGKSIFKYDAAFYLALSFLKEKDNSGAKKWLENIPAEASGYERAQELLREIN